MEKVKATYLQQVERLLHDLDGDDRASLLADLADQLAEIPDGAAEDVLGTPEAFVTEYRTSAGLSVPEPGGFPVWTLVSALLFVFGLFLLVSLSGAIMVAPLVVVAGWLAARRSPKSLRVAWSVLAGLLLGSMVRMLMIGPAGSEVTIAGGVLLAAILLVVVTLFYRTTEPPDGVAGEALDEGSGVAVVAIIFGALGLFTVWLLAPGWGDGSEFPLGLALASLAILTIVGLIVWRSSRS